MRNGLQTNRSINADSTKKIGLWNGPNMRTDDISDRIVKMGDGCAL